MKNKKHYQSLIKSNRLLSISLTLISLLLILLSILLFTGIIKNNINILPLLLIIFSGVIFVFSLSFMMISLTTKITEYIHNGIKISIYTGFNHYCLFVDDELKDECKKRLTIRNIYLKTNYNGYNIDITINMNNKIYLKINEECINLK